MTNEQFTPLHPDTVDIADVSVSALIRHLVDPFAGWEVCVVITKGPEQSRIVADEVTAEMLDLTGHAIPLVFRDAGLLAEAGDSLGVSANAIFRFSESHNQPAQLRVTFRGLTANFTT
ncbi:hypothetical protein MAUB1S_02902 [Mycolicibacterium aubagnense]